MVPAFERADIDDHIPTFARALPHAVSGLKCLDFRLVGLRGKPMTVQTLTAEPDGSLGGERTWCRGWTQTEAAAGPCLGAEFFDISGVTKALSARRSMTEASSWVFMGCPVATGLRRGASDAKLKIEIPSLYFKGLRNFAK